MGTTANETGKVKLHVAKCCIKTFSNAATQKVHLEAAANRDLVMIDFVHSYNNLTLKSLHAIQYFLSLKFSHMLKVDDDCFVNINALGNKRRSTF